jgi:hypothetical protein
MKGILIDAVNREVKEVEISGLEDMQKAVDGYITIGVDFGDDTLFVDDEGLLKGPEHFFVYEGAHQPFAGSGLILGTDQDGESVDTTMTVEQVRASVSFHGIDEIRRIVRG